MRVVVTGAAGMIGSVLIEALADLGHEVIGLDRVTNSWSERGAQFTRHADLLDPHTTWSAPPQCEVVVHLAANARVHDLVVDPTRALENVQTTFQALEYARAVGARFVFASSREVYGNQGAPRHAEQDVRVDVIESPYAASKLAGESFTRSFGRVYQLPWTIVRLSNVYGRNDLSERFIPAAFRAATRGETLPIYGRDKSLDFTYIDDAITGILAIVEQPEASAGQTFNLATGTAHTLIEAAEEVSRAIERRLDLRIEDARPGEVTAYEADIANAQARLGYAPQTSMHDGIGLAAPWYLERFGQSLATRGESIPQSA
jgi:nucleoside-diphosphate-sugar epimerase